VLPHGVARSFGVTGQDRFADRDMLALKGFEISALTLRPVRCHPNALPRDDEAAEIFKKVRELWIAGRGGDRAVKREIFLDCRLAAPQRLIADRRHRRRREQSAELCLRQPYQVAKFYSDSQHLIVPEMLVYSKAGWEQLSPDDQALLKKLSREAQADARDLWDKKEADAFDRMKSGNIEIDHIADKKPFQDAVKPVWDKYGSKFTDLIKQIQAVS
jgi:hypothetical protein